jgi:hypothetical protein
MAAAGLRWVQLFRALTDDALRIAWLRSQLGPQARAEAARGLDALIARAEAYDGQARALLPACIAALSAESSDTVQRLREEAAGAGLQSLDGFLRRHGMEAERPTSPSDPSDALSPARAGERPLTLGERKWKARIGSREELRLLLRDPHPEVVRRVLDHARLVEDDVRALATRRPNRGDVLREIACSARWISRPSVRRGLVSNPYTPVDVALGLVTLLLRQELEDVCRAHDLAPAIVARARERLANGGICGGGQPSSSMASRS